MQLRFYSGYIRNAEALRRELKLSGDSSEGEILLRGFERWGKSVCLHLYGAHAFAIETEDGLYCARDPLGLTPFFYHRTADGTLLFGDDIGKIAAHPKYQRKLNDRALRTFLMLGYPAGTETLFDGIRKLPAGHGMTFRNGEIEIERYYTLKYEPDHSRTEEEWMEEIERTALTIIAEDRQHPDFDHAESFLSGGVDSAYLLALNGVKSACGIGYAETDFDESRYAAETAALLGRDFRRNIISAEAYFDQIPKTVAALGLPLADASAVVFGMGCKSVSERTSLCFSGEGADEFFAGYWLYLRANELAWDDGPLHLGSSGVMAQGAMEKLLLSEDDRFSCDGLVRQIYAETENSEHLARLLSIDVQLFLEADILFGLARSSAVSGIQVRTPFADRRMFELAAKIPSELKLHDGVGKYILRRTAEGRLSHEIAFRKKMGFSVPVRYWIRQEGIRERVEKVLFGEASRKLFDQERLGAYWRNYQNGTSTVWSVIYEVYVFLIWYDQWFGV